VQPLGQQTTFYFGFVGGVSGDNNTLEIGREVASLLGLEDGMLVQVSIEYSYEKLNAIELEPVTVDDYEVVEQNCGQIEEQLLNQVGVFYPTQVFLLFLGATGTQTVRLKAKIDAANTSSCFYLTEACELHIIAKVRPRAKLAQPPFPERLSETETKTEETAEPALCQTLVVENTRGGTGFSDRLTVYDPDSYLGRLAHGGDCLVKVKLRARPSIADYSFKDFKTSKLAKQKLKLGDEGRLVYLRLETVMPTTSLLGDAVQASFCHGSIDASLDAVEHVEVALFPKSSAPSMAEHSLTIHYWSSSALLCQAAVQKDAIVAEVVLGLICYGFHACFKTGTTELVINEGSLFSLSSEHLSLSLHAQLLGAEGQTKKGIVLRRLLASLRDTDVFHFRVHFITP